MSNRTLLIIVRPSNLLPLNNSPSRTQTKPTTYARQPSFPMPSSPSSRLPPLSSTVNFSSTRTFSVSTPESQTFPNTTSSRGPHPVVSCPRSYQTSRWPSRPMKESDMTAPRLSCKHAASLNVFYVYMRVKRPVYRKQIIGKK